MFKLLNKNNILKGICIATTVALGILSTSSIIALSKSGSTAIGNGSDASGGSPGTKQYISSPAYAVYIANETPIADKNISVKDINEIKTKLDDMFAEVYAYKYPLWAPGVNYTYFIPTVEPRSGGTGSAHELAAMQYVAEVDRSYSSLSTVDPGDRLNKIDQLYDYTDYRSDGREYYYNLLSSGKDITEADLNAGMDYNTAKAIWGYIFSDGPENMSKNAGGFLYTEWKSPKGDADTSFWRKGAYVSLLMALETLSGDSKEANFNYIKMYTSKAYMDALDTMPTIIVERAFGFNSSQTVIDGLDLYQYATGMESGLNLRENKIKNGGVGPNEGVEHNDLLSLANAITTKLDQVDPGRPIRYSDDAISPYTGLIPLFGSNTYANSCTFPKDSNKHRLIDGLYTWNHLGYNILANSGMLNKQNVAGRQDIFTDEPKDNILPKGYKTVGENIPVHLEIDQTKSSSGDKIIKMFDDLNKKMEDKGIEPHYQLAMGIKRTITTGGSTSAATSESVLPLDSGVSNIAPNEWANKDTVDAKKITFDSYNTLKAFLTGGSQFEFEDQTKDIALNEEIKFDYYSTVKLRILKQEPGDSQPTYVTNPKAGTPTGIPKATDGTSTNYPETDAYGWMTLTRDDGYDYKKYRVNDNPYHYDSQPETYSEVKQNEPKAEEWEAMSGTPTTRPLYFASGGSEFAVTLDCTPMEGKMKRKYSVNFDAWKCFLYQTGACAAIWVPPYTDSDGNYHKGYWDHSKCDHAKPGTSPDPGGCPTEPDHHLGSWTTHWEQEINYNYMRINTAKVWKVKTSAVTGLKELTPMNSDTNGDMVAQIVSGDDDSNGIYTSIFTDTTDSSGGSKKTGSLEGGRLRFSEQPDVTDVSYHVANSGSSTEPWGRGQSEGGGACGERFSIPPARISDANAIKNDRKNDVFVQSDYLIIHTKEGDMVLNYSETSGHSDNLFSTINCPLTTDQMWWSNPLCTNKWTPTEINTFWYNGNYQNPQTCFDSKVSQFTFKNGMFEPMDMHYYESKREVDQDAIRQGWLTKQVFHEIPKPTSDNFNDYPMGQRWEKAQGMKSLQKNYAEENKPISERGDIRGPMEMWRQFNPKVTHANGEYDIGNSSILYERILNYNDPATGNIMSYLDKGYYDRYGSGLTLADEAKYEKEASKSYLVVHSSYSLKHTNCNDIVLHNPVSSQYSYVISLPESRDQRIDTSKTIAGNAFDSITQEDTSESNLITNPNYHNNLIFNGFVASEKSSNNTLGWKSSIDTALGWETFISPPTYKDYTFGCDENSGIVISNDGSGIVQYYQDIQANSGDTYSLSYNVKGVEGNKATVTLLYLDSSNKIVDKNKSSKIRIVIDQKVGKSVINEVKVIDTSRGGFIPNNTKVYDTVIVNNVDDGIQGTQTKVDKLFHYYYRNENDDSLVDCKIRPEDRVLGSDLIAQEGYTLDTNAYYIYDSFYIAYNSTDTSMLTDAFAKIKGAYSGTEVIEDGSITNTVIGKTFSYKGYPELFSAPEEGDYYIEAFGANGGNYVDSSSNILKTGGKGAYTNGVIHLTKNQVIALYVGGRGYNNNKFDTTNYIQDLSDHTLEKDGQDAYISNGYNGGGYSTTLVGSGGGATDIRTYENYSDLSSRLLVSGGGAGASSKFDGGNAIESQLYTNTYTLGTGETPLKTVKDADNYDVLKVDATNAELSSGGGGYYGGKAENNSTQATGGDSYKDSGKIYAPSANVPDKIHPSWDGNGKVSITYLNHLNKVTSENQKMVRLLSTHQYNNNPPSDAFVEAPKKNTNNPSVITDTKGINKVDTFLNLDYGFSVYFPNEGDFGEDPSLHGIPRTTKTKGYGFTDRMDTTEWTYAKYVKFPFNVIHDGIRYASGTKIYLDVNKEYFDFYCTLGNHEMKAALVDFVALAVNNENVSLKGSDPVTNLYKDGKVCIGGTGNTVAKQDPKGDTYKTPQNSEYIMDAECTKGHTGHYQNPHEGIAVWENGEVKQKATDCYTFKQYLKGEASLENTVNINFDRDAYKRAKHSAIEKDKVDIVGRIGNFIIDDVGDPRFSNFFKKSDGSGNFIIPGVIPTVDSSKQNHIIGDITDIRGMNTTQFQGYDENKNMDLLGNRGSSKNTLLNPLRDLKPWEESKEKLWVTSMGEADTANNKGRPGAEHTGDLSNDPKKQTAYNYNEVFGGSIINRDSFLNTYERVNTFGGKATGLHDNEFGQLASKASENLKNSFPLTPDINNIEAVKDQALRLGYPVYQDVQTIGDYYKGYVQVVPTYYALDLSSDNTKPTIIPIDIYMSVSNSYMPINLFGASQVELSTGGIVSILTNESTKEGEYIKDSKGNILKDKYNNKLKYRYIYDNKQFIDWDNENIRRNSAIGISQIESQADEMKYTNAFKPVGDKGNLIKDKSASLEWKNSKRMEDTYMVNLPYGMYYTTGNNQMLKLTERCRTFIGENSTDGNEINKLLAGDRDNEWKMDYNPNTFILEGQRWHFTNNLPSSAVAIRAGSRCNTININELRKDNYVILTALDLKAVGNVWTLEYDNGGQNDEVQVFGKKYKIDAIDKGKVVTVTAINKSSKDDRNITGTH